MGRSETDRLAVRRLVAYRSNRRQQQAYEYYARLSAASLLLGTPQRERGDRGSFQRIEKRLDFDHKLVSLHDIASRQELSEDAVEI